MWIFLEAPWFRVLFSLYVLVCCLWSIVFTVKSTLYVIYYRKRTGVEIYASPEPQAFRVPWPPREFVNLQRKWNLAFFEHQTLADVEERRKEVQRMGIYTLAFLPIGFLLLLYGT